MPRAGSCANLLAAMSVLVILVLTGRAEAAERFLAPVQDRYEPGDTATLVGYVSVQEPPAAASGLRATESPSEMIPIGRLVVERSSLGSQVLRVSISFEVPPDAPAGEYEIVTEPDGVVAGLLYVGVDPPQPPVRVWPAAEPEIANLLPGAPVVPPTTPPTASPITQSVATTASVVSPGPPPTTAPVVVPNTGEANGANIGLLLAGSAVAAVCTGLVLLALRQS